MSDCCSASAAPKPVFTVVLDASLEVRTAVVYATFVVALVFVPVLAMGGIQGKLFSPLGLAYILAIMVSLVVALTLTPVLAFAFFHKKVPTRGEPKYIVRLKERHRNLLRANGGKLVCTETSKLLDKTCCAK